MNGTRLADLIAIFLILQAGAEETAAPGNEAIVHQAAQAISSQYWDSVEQIRANAR